MAEPKKEEPMSMYNKRFILALIVVILSFGYAFGVTFMKGVTPDDFISGILLSGCLMIVISFYFGSSDNKGKQINPVSEQSKFELKLNKEENENESKS